MLPPAVKHLLIINTLVYLISWLMHMDDRFLLCLYPFGEGFRLWQPVTYMFMHGSFSHLFFNMFTLWMFGNVLENSWGTARFLRYYLICGIGAGLLSMLVQPAILLGASGACFGLLAAFGMMFPEERIYLYFLLPIKAKWFVIGYAAIELINGIYTADGIAHFAHLFGAAIGVLLILWWRKHPFSRI